MNIICKLFERMETDNIAKSLYRDFNDGTWRKFNYIGFGGYYKRLYSPCNRKNRCGRIGNRLRLVGGARRAVYRFCAIIDTRNFIAIRQNKKWGKKYPFAFFNLRIREKRNLYRDRNFISFSPRYGCGACV